MKCRHFYHLHWNAGTIQNQLVCKYQIRICVAKGFILGKHIQKKVSNSLGEEVLFVKPIIILTVLRSCESCKC